MGENLKILYLKNYLKKKVSPIIFLVQEHLNMMVLWKGKKKKPSNRWLEHYLMSKAYKTIFWEEAVNTTCYILNKVFIIMVLNKTPYELRKGRKPSVSYFQVFGYKCYILKNKDNLGKFGEKSDNYIYWSFHIF